MRELVGWLALGGFLRGFMVKVVLKAILFDLDGTLANTDPLHCEVFRQLLEPYGLAIDEAFYQTRISGRTNQALLRDLFPDWSEDQVEAFAEHKEAQFRAIAQDKLQPLPGIVALLDRLDVLGIRRAVVTNAPRINAEFMLEAIALSDRFETLVLGQELPRAKPDPLPYQEALRRLAIAPEDALVFEDSATGIRAGLAAGITTIGVASTHAPAQLLALGAQGVIHDFSPPQLAQLGTLLPSELVALPTA